WASICSSQGSGEVLAEGMFCRAAAGEAAGLEKKTGTQPGQVFEEDKAMIYKPTYRDPKTHELRQSAIYWYKFMWNGELVRESSKRRNDKVARQMESAHRRSLAKGEVGIRERKVAPTLKEFCSGRVEPWARSRFENTCRKNWTWYRTGIRALTAYKPM